MTVFETSRTAFQRRRLAHPRADYLPRLGTIAALAGIAILGPYVLGQFGMHIANLGTIMGIAAMSLTVLVGQAGLLSLGQAAFMGIGAFTAGYVASRVPMDVVPLLLIAGAAGMVIGALVAAATLRAVGLYLAVGTLAVQYVTEIVLTDIEIKVTQATGFLMPEAYVFGFPVSTESQWLIVNIATAIVVFLLLSWIVRSHIGRAWMVARDHPTIAAALGISVPRARVSVFMLTSFIAAAAGALQGFYAGVVQVGNYPLHWSIMYLTIVVLGRPGNLTGALIAAYVIALLPHSLETALLALGSGPGRGAASIENLTLGIILGAALLHTPQRIWRRLRSAAGV